MRKFPVLLLIVFLAAAASAQETGRDQKVNCILCKITELAILVAAPLLILALIGATPIALLIFVVYGSKRRDQKEDANKKAGAKKIMIVTAIIYGLMAAVLLIIGVLVFTGVVGGGCDMCAKISR